MILLCPHEFIRVHADCNIGWGNDHDPRDYSEICNLDRGDDHKIILLNWLLVKLHIRIRSLLYQVSMHIVYWKFFGFPATDEGDILTKVKIVCILCRNQIAYNRNTTNLRMHLQNKHAQELLELEMATPPKKQVLFHDTKDCRAQKYLMKADFGTAQDIYATNVDGTVQIDGDKQFVTDLTVSLCGMEDDITIGQPLHVMIKSGTTVGTNSQKVAFLMPKESSSQRSSIDGKSVSDAIAEFIIMDLQLPEVVEGQGFQRLIATLHSPCESHEPVSSPANLT